MKTLLTTFFMAMTFVCLATNPPGIKDDIKVTFNGQMTFDDLVELKQEMADKGITLDYSLIHFNEMGHLSAITCEIDCNDGFSGGFTKVNLPYKSSSIGFVRSYAGSCPFATGDIGFALE